MTLSLTSSEREERGIICHGAEVRERAESWGRIKVEGTYGVGKDGMEGISVVEVEVGDGREVVITWGYR